LDGAAILLMKDRPIIGMTLRYDRLDNFWYTLVHELAHVALHFDSDKTQFIDDLDIDAKNDVKEREADELAREILVPSSAWTQSPASRQRSADAALHLAKRLNIHPAIVAGRMRHHWKAYRLLNNLVGHGNVRSFFTDVKWET
jgi:HTH-type transcriptional regulator/antitoxin HigA